MSGAHSCETPSPAALVEAVLLVSSRPVSLSALAHAADLDRPVVEDALQKLQRKYDPEKGGIFLRRVAGGFQFATSPACAETIERFRRESRPAPLSNAAHEVLACVLYLGPTTRAVVSAARGVNSDALVRSLVDRGLLAETGRDAEAPGSPAVLDVTEDFLVSAGAAGREGFPALDSLVSEEELERVRERVESARTGSGSGPDLRERT